MPTILPPDVPWPLLRLQDNRANVYRGFWQGLGHGADDSRARTCRLPRAHVFVTLRGPRSALIGRLGEWPYKGLMSVVSLAGLILIGYGFGRYRATGWIDVWSPPPWTYYVTQLLMWPASICVVAAYSRGNIWRTLKPPMLGGVKTWAIARPI